MTAMKETFLKSSKFAYEQIVLSTQKAETSKLAPGGLFRSWCYESFTRMGRSRSLLKPTKYRTLHRKRRPFPGGVLFRLRVRNQLLLLVSILIP
jgi:hypothetical protein